MRMAAILAVLFVGSLAIADDEKPTVKELPTKDLKIVPNRASKATEPTIISSLEELTKNGTLGDSADEIKKQVNFEKQKLVLFVWAGSGQDKMTASIGADSDKKPIVYIEYLRGLTRDLRPHARLYVVPKDLKVEVDTGK